MSTSHVTQSLQFPSCRSEVQALSTLNVVYPICPPCVYLPFFCCCSSHNLIVDSTLSRATRRTSIFHPPFISSLQHCLRECASTNGYNLYVVIVYRRKAFLSMLRRNNVLAPVAAGLRCMRRLIREMLLGSSCCWTGAQKSIPRTAADARRWWLLPTVVRRWP